MSNNTIIPILRSFDESKAREFYIDFLGFEIKFEHRFADDLPLYMEIVKDGWVIHLSEHHGDACPGAAIMLRMENLKAYQEGLIAKQYQNSRPGCEKTDWGTMEMTIHDPFGNKLTFFENLETDNE